MRTELNDGKVPSSPKGLCGVYVRTNEPHTKLNLSAEQVHGIANVNGDRLPP